MAKKQYYIDRTPIPAGFQIYVEWLEVAGVGHRRAEAIAFINGRAQRLEFELEPTNPHDPNAIRIIGCTKKLLSLFEQRRHIGYVPARLAKTIARAGLRDQVRPRLWKTYLGDDGYVEVGFQLLGPAGHQAKALFDRYGD